MIGLCFFLILILILENFIFFSILRQRNGLIKQSYCQTEKFRIFFELLVEWFAGDMSGKNIGAWISENGYKTVAIYGMGALGELTYLNLCKYKEIYVKYGLDRNASIKIAGLDIFNLNDSLEKVDLIIVTAVTAYEEIKKEINLKTDFECKIISLMQLIEEMYV